MIQGASSIFKSYNVRTGSNFLRYAPASTTVVTTRQFSTNKFSSYCRHGKHEQQIFDPTQDESYLKLFEGNREFVKQKLNLDPNFFKDMASKNQTPQYMLIGCSDSRVPPDQLTMTGPGEIFIHRNVANLVVNTDLNMMSVLQYAVEVLRVKHVIVMGHYNCGGVRASMEATHHGLIDKWLRNIKDIQRIHKDKLDALPTFEEKFKLLVELNVVEQTLNVCKTSIIQKAWAKGQDVSVHGWVYDLATGYIKDLEYYQEGNDLLPSIESSWEEINSIYKIEFPDIKEE